MAAPGTAFQATPAAEVPYELDAYDEVTGGRFYRDFSNQGDDTSQWDGSQYATVEGGRKDRKWDKQHVERRARRYVIDGDNPEGDNYESEIA